MNRELTVPGRFSPRAVLTAFVLFLLALFPGLAAARQGLPPDLVRATAELSPEGKTQLADFVNNLATSLGDNDPAVVARSRRQLGEPLADASASVPFRLAYSQALVPTLETLAKDTREVVAVNALRLAGEIATDRSVAVAESQLERTEAPVRFTAAAALGRSLDAAARSAPAMTPERAERTISALARRLAVEKDAHIIDAVARALVSGLAVDRPRFESVRSRAFSELCKAIGDRVKSSESDAIDPEWMTTIVTATSAARDAMTAAIGSGSAQAVSLSFPDGARLAGDVLGYVARLVQAGALPTVQPGEDPAVLGDDRAVVRQAVAVAEVMASLAFDEARAQRPPNSAGLAELLRASTVADDARFLDRVSLLIAGDGALVKQFNFPKDRFSNK